MNDEQAKKILALYRPGTPDKSDPLFQAAFELAKPPAQSRWQEPPNRDLSTWFQEHRASYLSIRGKFLMIPAPSALKDRILAEHKTPSRTIIPFRPATYWAMAAMIIVLLSLAMYFFHAHPGPDDFNTYRTRMARIALRPYSMDLESQELQSIHAYLSGRSAPSDYVLPDGMLKAQAVGCAVVQWQGEAVSMLCFRSAQPLPAGEKSDLWLFVRNTNSETLLYLQGRRPLSASRT
jgi:hypothetical protein